ncbi:MAG: hypothetical protein P1P76_08560 [Anaerolineales bacterium]|nr:hypothetical protein [Anaerolineales bacterium]
MTLLQRIWSGWKKVGQAIGDLIARLVLSVLYFTIVLPFGLITRLGRDPLDLHRTSETCWQERSTHDHTLEDGRRLS